MKILVIDNDPGWIGLLQEYISEHLGTDHQMVSAETLTDAREILVGEEVDIAVVDIELDQKGGTEGLDLLRWMVERGLRTQAIVVTSYSTDDRKKEALRLGADYVSRDIKDREPGLTLGDMIGRRLKSAQRRIQKQNSQ